jgi:hypothetical protein
VFTLRCFVAAAVILPICVLDELNSSSDETNADIEDGEGKAADISKKKRGLTLSEVVQASIVVGTVIKKGQRLARPVFVEAAESMSVYLKGR